MTWPLAISPQTSVSPSDFLFSPPLTRKFVCVRIEARGLSHVSNVSSSSSLHLSFETRSLIEPAAQ